MDEKGDTEYNITNENKIEFIVYYNELQQQLTHFIDMSRIFDDDIKFVVKNSNDYICHKVTIVRRKNYTFIK